jgi:hypothetical protein
MLAWWGAVTGTIGILLQLRAFLHDRPRLKVTARLHLFADSGRQLEITVVNRGRRTLYTDSVVIERRVTLGFPARGVRRVSEECRESSTQRELKEGEGFSLFLADLDTDFEAYDVSSIFRIGIVDRTGKKWWSREALGEQVLFSAGGSYSIWEEDLGGNRGQLILFRDRRGYSVAHWEPSGPPAKEQKYPFFWRICLPGRRASR